MLRARPGRGLLAGLFAPALTMTGTVPTAAGSGSEPGVAPTAIGSGSEPGAASTAAGSGTDVVSGQVEMALTAEHGRPASRTATFHAPLGQASVVVDTVGGTNVVVQVNDRTVPAAMSAARDSRPARIDLSGYTAHGVNRISVAVTKGAGTFTVPFATLVDGEPSAVSMDPEILGRIDRVVTADLGPEANDRYTGAVVLVVKDGVVVKHDAYGDAQTYDGTEPLDPPVPMTPETSFDLASVTKVLSTTAAVMRLVEEGRIDLDAPVARWIPAFTGGGKEQITVRHLLTHTSGLWEWQPTYLHADGWEGAIDYVVGLDLRYGVGEGRHYSDLGFMLLGEVLRIETGLPLDEYVRTAVHEPLGMTRTAYIPDVVDGPFAATSLGNSYEYDMIENQSPYPILEGRAQDFDGWRDHTLVGEVNDGNAAYGFGGVAGHAGLFAPARDVATFGQTLLNGGGYDTFELASQDVVSEFTSDQFQRGQGLGFWTNRLASVDGPGAGGVGHNGFTGTDFLVDKERGTVVVLLTNRLHPDRPDASTSPVWTQVLRAVVEADGRP